MTMTSAHADAAREHPAISNSLDDIFGSSPPRETSDEFAQPRTETPTAAEPSDLPSLRRQHVTAGYRDGVSASKGQHVQRGFDAGFPVGAQLGMRAGTILGILEGVLRGLEGRTAPGVVKKPARDTGSTTTRDGKTEEDAEVERSRRGRREQIQRLYERAVKELDVQAVFAGAEAGASAVSASESKTEIEPSAKAGESAESQLAQKGNAVISKWEERVAVPRWEEKMEVFEKDGPEDDKDERQGHSG